MKFTAAILALATSVVALPNVGPSGMGEAHGKEVAKPGGQQPFWPLQQDVTVQEAKAACGNEAQVACCDDVSYAGDTTDVTSGPLAGALSNLLNGKNGAQGLALFSKCSKLNVDLLIGVSDIVNQQCKQNIACCQNNSASSDGTLIGLDVPCVALGSLL
ncbi:hypothetical protein VTN77DRAFT_2705 [Rasamsonia byssochlamydoides]|uniref:uncharacterized protein n=1 Tax=Rasamsonia byssochlamydoides TaxID=89139 RepID=UPI0037441D42